MTFRTTWRTALAATTLAVSVAACGGDDGGSDAAGTAGSEAVAATSEATTTAAAPATTAKPTTTAAPATTAAPTTAAPTTTAAAAELAGDELAAATAYEVVFDSATPAEAKAPHLADAAALAPTIAAYSAAGTGMGGIALDVTAVTIDGDAATVTYDVLFGGKAAYQAMAGSINRTGGTWVVARDEFCSFMASARTPCQ